MVDEIADSLVETMADNMPYWRCGDPLDPDTLVGTVIDAQAAQAAVAVVESAARSGARILAGGVRDGALVHPTLIDRCKLGMPLVDTEVFAPIAPVIRVRDVNGAIAAANAGPYGLSCGVFTQSISKAAMTVNGVRTGSVNINEVPGWRLEVTPFGGIGDSGIGVKEGIARMINFFQFERLVSFDALHS